MEKENKYLVKKGIHYLSDVPEIKENGLPQGYLINKTVTGCGGTTVALQDNYNTVICVPFTALVDCKVYLHPNILPVYAGVRTAQIKNYVQSTTGVKKIMCTYDSLGKVLNVIDPKEYRLLVDEYHLLFSCYDYRYKVVNIVLNSFRKFMSWSFMTATPIPYDFILDELKDIPTYTYEWEDVIQVTVNALRVNRGTVKTKVINIVRDFLNNVRTGNAHFFVNSVRFIENIITEMRLTNENCKVVISKHNKDYKKSVGGITIGLGHSAPKKINFYTSTCFEGCDIMDEEGHTFIVSDPSLAHTLLDISTQIPQIAGRIRNSKYRNLITHIYKNTRYSDTTLEDYQSGMDEMRNKAMEWTDWANSSEHGIEIKKSIYNDYVKLSIDNKWYFDDNLIRLELHNFKTQNYVYQNKINLTNEYRGTEFTLNIVGVKVSELLRDNANVRTVFKDAFEEYATIMDSEEAINKVKHRIEALIRKYPYIRDAYEQLGAEFVKRVNFDPTRIKKELIRRSPHSESDKIRDMLLQLPWFKVGAFVSAKEIKKDLGEIFLQLGIDKKPNSTDLKRFASLKSCVRQDRGFKIITIYNEQIWVK